MSTLLETPRAEVERSKGEIRVNGILYTASILVRHQSDCKDREKGGSWAKCDCWKSLLVYNGATKKQKMIAAKVRSWSRAEAKAEEWLDQFDPTKREQKRQEAAALTVEQAIAEYVKTRDWKPGTHKRGKSVWGDGKGRKGSFIEWVDTLTPRPILISEVTPAHIDGWRASLNSEYSDLSVATLVTNVKSFFRFAKSRGYIQIDPAYEMKRPKVEKGNRTTYFSDEQYRAILKAAEGDQRLTAFVELMRWTGMALEDATVYQSRCINGDVLTYRRSKTGTMADPTIPEHLIVLLRNVPLEEGASPDMPFRRKDKTLGTDKMQWWRRLTALFAAAGIKEVQTDFGPRAPHPHMLRDTFAVENILAGTPLIDVTRMLGHSSTKITEKHYLHWINAMDEAHHERSRAGLAAQVAKVKPQQAGQVVTLRKRA